MRGLVFGSIALVLAGCGSGRTNEVAPAAARAHASPYGPFAVVRVDDSIDPIAVDPDRELPWGAGMAPFHERSMVGDGHIVDVHFVRIVMGGHESAWDACDRFQNWVHTAHIVLPAGDAFACGDVLEEDPSTKEATTVGVRTFVLTGTPVITKSDVADAYLGDDLKDDTDDFLDVAVKLTPEGRKKLHDVTAEWTHRRLAILRYGMVSIAPLVKGVIDSDTLTVAFGRRSNAELDKAQAFVRDLLGK